MSEHNENSVQNVPWLGTLIMRLSMARTPATLEATLSALVRKFPLLDAPMSVTLPSTADMLGPEHPHTNRVRCNFARMLLADGNVAQAVTFSEAALAAHEKAFGKGHPWTKDSARVTADALDAQSRADEAAALRARHCIGASQRTRGAVRTAAEADNVPASGSDGASPQWREPSRCRAGVQRQSGRHLPAATLRAGSRMTDLKLFEDKASPGAWRVEYFDDDGGCYVTVFGGHQAENRARDYYVAMRTGLLASHAVD
jgi:hypothetical protein